MIAVLLRAIRSARQVAAGVALAVVTLGAAAPAAQSIADRFEIVSIRRVPNPCALFSTTVRCDTSNAPRMFVRLFEGRLEASNVSMMDLIRVAYGVERGHASVVRGESRWMVNDRYDVIGITGDQSTGTLAEYPHTRRQLQALLRDRFGLRVEMQSKKATVQVLTRVAGAGVPGLRPVPAPCRPADSPASSQTTTVAGCELQFTSLTLKGTGVTMGELARALSSRISAPVVDETGLEGFFDVSLTLDSATASLENALADQLGFALTSGIRQAPVITIKDARKPVEE